MATTSPGTDRWKALDFAPPAVDADEPDHSVLVDYRKDGQIAVVTLNRPHADNAITTEMGARLTEIEAPFDPEGGAYADSAHDRAEDHGHHHAHDHHAGHDQAPDHGHHHHEHDEHCGHGHPHGGTDAHDHK